jgi:peroxiredoxin/Tfp pilus assembly protein PilF
MRILRAGVAGVLLTACLVTVSLIAQESNPAFDSKVKQADSLLKTRQWEPALKAYKEANALMDKKSALAHLGMAKAYQGLRAHKSAADACTEALKHTNGNKPLDAEARNLRGTSNFTLAEKHDDNRLKQAEEDFRAVLAMVEGPHIAQYNLGVVLMKMRRDEEGTKELEAFVSKAGRAPEVATAKKFIADPRRARDFFAPEFSFTTYDGEYVSLEDLKGKVVLVDFWATWCPPCVTAVPGLKRLHERMKDQPFVILGISADRSREAWQAFIVGKSLKWHHYFDERGQLARSFNIEAFPTYLLLDHEGIVRHAWRGYDGSVDGDIEREAKKLIKAIAR